MAIGTPEARFERWRTRGEAAALGDVFDALAPGLLRLAIHLVGDPAAAEDLVQQTFVTAMERAASWDARRPLEPWLQGILANHARDLKKSARRAFDPDFDLATVLAREEDAPLESASRRELSGELARAVDALDEPYRAAVLLRLRHGMEAADIAHVLGRSPGAVRVQLHRARELLRKTLPASIASALLLLAEPARGLECARNQTLEHAARLAPAASVGGGLLGGVFAVKQILIAVLVVVALLAATLWFVRPDVSIGGAQSAVAIERVEIESARGNTEVVALANAEVATRASIADVTAESAETWPFRCRIVDGLTDEPIEGARVRFYPPRSSPYSEIRARWPERFRSSAIAQDFVHDWPWFAAKLTANQRLDLEPVLSYEGPTDDEAPLAEGVTNARGEFESSIAHRAAFVVVEADGYASRGQPPELERRVHVTGTDGKPTIRTFVDDALVVRLYRTRRLTGAVVDTQGERISRAVRLRVEGFGPGDVLEGKLRGQRAVDSWTVVTDASGRFTLDIAGARVSFRSLESGWCVATTAVHPVKKKAWHFTGQLAFDGPDEIAWVPLRRQPSIVVVSAADGRPVRDYWMQIREFEIDEWPRGGLARVRSQDGRAAILDAEYLDGTHDSLPLRTFAVQVFAEDFVPAVVHIADARSAEDVTVRLEPGPHPTIRGRVVENGRPLAEVGVMLTAATRSSMDCDPRGAGSAVRTDAQGAFSIPAAPGSWVVIADHAGSVHCRTADVSNTASILIDVGSESAIEFVVDGDESRRNEIWAAISSAAEYDAGASKMVDEHGRALFGSLAPGRYTVRVGGAGGFVADPSDREFDLVAGTTRTVRFRSAANEPPRVMRVIVDGISDLGGWRACVWTGGIEWRPVEPDGRVALQFGSLAPQVAVSSPDGQRYDFLVSLDTSGEVPLHIPARRGSYAGVIRRVGGSGLAGWSVAVTLENDSGGLRCVTDTTDARGNFRLDAVPRGARWLQMSNDAKDEFATLTFTCAEDATTPPHQVVIEIPASAKAGQEHADRIQLSGVVRGASRSSIPMIWLHAFVPQAGGELQVATSTTIEADGSYRVDTLSAPRHHVTFLGPQTEAFVQFDISIPTDVTEFRQDFDLP